MAVFVECPTCKRKVEFTPENRWRPFCSQRCKTVDLGAWASNQYVVPGNAQEGTSSDAGEGGADLAADRPPRGPRQ